MKINIKATNIKLNDAIYNYIEQKIGELDKFVQEVGIKDWSFQGGKPPYEAWIEIGKPSMHHRTGNVYYAEVQLRLPGKSIRSESENWDLRLAIDEVKDELQRKLKEYKERQTAKFKRGARMAKKDLQLSKEARLYRKGRIREEGI